jgi:nitrogen fixation NifU-like protein
VSFIEKDGIIEDIAFMGSGCAISKASASIMTSTLKSMKVDDAKVLFEKFHTLATTGESPHDMGKLSVLSGVHKYPARVKCATLAWHTFLGALNNSQEIIKTE